MKKAEKHLRVRSILDGSVHNAVLSTEHAASSYGIPVLLIDGELVDSLLFREVPGGEPCD